VRVPPPVDSVDDPLRWCHFTGAIDGAEPKTRSCLTGTQLL